MLLTIDIGNTDIVSVLYDNDKNKINSERISLVDANIREEYGYFSDVFKRWNLSDIDYIVSCVVPAITSQVKKELDTLSSGRGIYLDVNLVPQFVAEREEVGADLIAASYSFRNLVKPTIIVDMGSATKIILVKDGILQSVAIILGVKNTMKSLAQSIQHLPEVKLEFTEDLLGVNTIDAIQAGLMYSQYYSLKGYTDAIETKLGIPVKKVLTGGIGYRFKDKLNEFSYKADLVNDGLYEIFMEEIAND